MMEIVVPSLSTQQRIAGILSAYDNLIENSQRRIKILESMARALYREWFVAFRFPGHEAHPRVPSPLGEIPKGWNVQRLDELSMSIQDGDWVETKDQGGEDFRLLQISNIGLGEFIETGNFRYVTQETFSRLRCSEIEPNDLLIARMPTPIGRGWLATNMPWRMITAVDVAIIRAEPSVVLPIFLAQAWNEPANLARIAAQASGTTRLRITRRELAAMEFIVPPISLQGQFAAFAGPIAEMVQRLRQQSQNLRITRDLLLPRLLSEQLDVSAGLPEEEPILAVERAAPAPKPASAPRPVPPRAAAPPPPPAREAPAPGRADLEPEALLAAIRQLFGDGAARDRDTALRDLAQSLGHQRLGKRIKENLASALLTAVRRGILTNSQGAYTLGFRTVEDCTRDSLKADFVSSLGRSWATRTEAIQGFARYLGFSRTGPVLDDTARSLINGLIREGRLETDDPDRIRRT